MIRRKFPVQQLADQIRADWAPQLCLHFGVESLDVLQAMNFPPEGIRLKLMDGSEVQFAYAFAIVDSSRRAIAVFTEHCGYHVFPFFDAELYVGGKLVFCQAQSLDSNGFPGSV